MLRYSHRTRKKKLRLYVQMVGSVEDEKRALCGTLALIATFVYSEMLKPLENPSITTTNPQWPAYWLFTLDMCLGACLASTILTSVIASVLSLHSKGFVDYYTPFAFLIAAFFLILGMLLTLNVLHGFNLFVEIHNAAVDSAFTSRCTQLPSSTCPFTPYDIWEYDGIFRLIVLIVCYIVPVLGILFLYPYHVHQFANGTHEIPLWIRSMCACFVVKRKGAQ